MLNLIFIKPMIFLKLFRVENVNSINFHLRLKFLWYFPQKIIPGTAGINIK